MGSFPTIPASYGKKKLLVMILVNIVPPLAPAQRPPAHYPPPPRPKLPAWGCSGQRLHCHTKQCLSACISRSASGLATGSSCQELHSLVLVLLLLFPSSLRWEDCSGGVGQGGNAVQVKKGSGKSGEVSKRIKPQARTTGRDASKSSSHL
ncbi:uncharacterized protein [Physcomitrium patens]|uniref:uncharacterized protein n=1 Tax=Physcomitrium patens TaxID=3218 RepID=UPI003CCE0466